MDEYISLFNIVNVDAQVGNLGVFESGYCSQVIFYDGQDVCDVVLLQ